MLFKLINGKMNVTYVLKQGYNDHEILPGMLNAKRFEQGGEDRQGISVLMSPYYQTDADTRFHKDQKLKEWVEEALLNHPKFGMDFSTWGPEKETFTMTGADMQELLRFRSEVKGPQVDLISENKRLADESNEKDKVISALKAKLASKAVVGSTK